MTDVLLKMLVGETKEIKDEAEYNVAVSTACRLKRSGKGQWTFSSSFMGNYIKRIK